MKTLTYIHLYTNTHTDTHGVVKLVHVITSVQRRYKMPDSVCISVYVFRSFVISRIHLNTFGWNTPGRVPVCCVCLNLSLPLFSPLVSHTACSTVQYSFFFQIYQSNSSLHALGFCSLLYVLLHQKTGRSMCLLTLLCSLHNGRPLWLKISHHVWACFQPTATG